MARIPWSRVFRQHNYDAANASATFTIGALVPTMQVSDNGGVFNGGAFPATTTMVGINGIPVTASKG